MTQEVVGDGAGWQSLPLGDGTVMFASNNTAKDVVAGVLLAEIARRDKDLYDAVLASAIRERLPLLLQQWQFEVYYDLRADNPGLSASIALEVPIAPWAMWMDIYRIADIPIPETLKACDPRDARRADPPKPKPDPYEPPPANAGQQPIPQAAD